MPASSGVARALLDDAAMQPISRRRSSRTAVAASALLLSSLASSAHAEPAPDAPASPPLRSMTLAEALAYADAHQPSMRLARARVEAARAQADVPRSQWLPKVGALAELMGGTSNNTTSSYVGNSVIDIPRIGGTAAITSDKLDAASLKPYGSSFVGVGLDQEIFDFGRIAVQTAAFDAQADAEGYRAETDRLDLELSVRESFFAVSSAKSIVQAADAAFARAKSQRDLTKAGVDNGLRTPVDLARAEADLARYDVGRVRSRGALELARGLLATTIGFSGAEVDATEEVPTAAQAESLDEALTDASKRDPALAAARARVKAQSETTRAIDAERRPNLYLTSTLSGRAGGAPLANGATTFGRGFLPVIPNWDVGVVLSVPIFDGVTNARKRASVARETVLKEEVDLVREKETEDVERAYFSVQTAEASVPALERARDAAKTSYEQTEARFQQGLGTSVELLEAQALLTEAEIQLSIGRFELARARARLGRAIAEPRGK